MGCISCNTAVNLTGCLMRAIKDVLVAAAFLLGRQENMPAAAQIQDELLCHVPEGDID